MMHARRCGDDVQLLGDLVPVRNRHSHACNILTRPCPWAPQVDTELLVFLGVVRRLRLLPAWVRGEVRRGEVRRGEVRWVVGEGVGWGVGEGVGEGPGQGPLVPPHSPEPSAVR